MKLTRKGLVITSIFTACFFTLLLLNFSTGEKKIESRLNHLYSIEDAQFKRSIGTLLGPPILEGNKVEVLLNGDEIFPAMLSAIHSAKKTITFETFIYWSESIGEEFADALIERAKAGVKIHILLDWIGSRKMETRFIDEMRAAGIQVVRYHKPEWQHITRLNNRTHRKLLIIDGKVGFTGGVGIADQWRGHAQDVDHWRDTHFRVEGPTVAQMQAVFLDNWTKSTGQILHGHDYFPPLGFAGAQDAQMFSSSPSGGSDSMHLMYLLAITSATKSIYLSSSYFLPDELTIRALVAAVKRGVKIKIIVPNKNIDTELVRQASRAQWGPLLQNGIEIYEYQPTMFHCKVLIVDGLLVSVGSTNFDIRSFRINDEANLNVMDASFARQQEKIFQDDLHHSKKISFTQWVNRPWWSRIIERCASLFNAQL